MIPSNYPIRPEFISTEHHFSNIFGTMEKDISAFLLIRFAQLKLKSWDNFAKKDLEEFCEQEFSFNNLTKSEVGNQPPMILTISETAETYGFTHKFIARCFANAPNAEFKEYLSVTEI